MLACAAKNQRPKSCVAKKTMQQNLPGEGPGGSAALPLLLLLLLLLAPLLVLVLVLALPLAARTFLNK